MCNKQIISNKSNKYTVQVFFEPSTQIIPEEQEKNIVPYGKTGFIPRTITSSLINSRDLSKYDKGNDIEIINKFFLDRKGKIANFTNDQFDLIYALSYYFTICFINDDDVIKKLNYLELGGENMASLSKPVSLRMLSKIIYQSEKTRFLEKIYDNLMFLSTTKYAFTYTQRDNKRNERVKRLSISEYININIDAVIEDSTPMDPASLIKQTIINNDNIYIKFSKYFIFGVGKHSRYQMYTILKPNYFLIIRKNTNGRNPILRPLINRIDDQWPLTYINVLKTRKEISHKYKKIRLTEEIIKETELAQSKALFYEIDIDEFIKLDVYKNYKDSYKDTRVIRNRNKEYLEKALETLINEIGILTEKSRIDWTKGKIYCFYNLDYNKSDELELLEQI